MSLFFIVSKYEKSLTKNVQMVNLWNVSKILVVASWDFFFHRNNQLITIDIVASQT